MYFTAVLLLTCCDLSKITMQCPSTSVISSFNVVLTTLDAANNLLSFMSGEKLVLLVRERNCTIMHQATCMSTFHSISDTSHNIIVIVKSQQQLGVIRNNKYKSHR